MCRDPSIFFFSSRRRHTRCSRDWSSDVCSSDLYLSKYFVKWINKPMLKALAEAGLDAKLIYTHPAGALNLVITVGVYLGIVLASPVVLYQIWLFVAPALYKHERGAVTGFMSSTIFLFLAGIAFGYFVMLQIGRAHV